MSTITPSGKNCFYIATSSEFLSPPNSDESDGSVNNGREKDVIMSKEENSVKKLSLFANGMIL